MGSLISNLTKAGVQQPSGATQYYGDPASATAAASKQIPSPDSIAGPDILHPNTSQPSPLPRVVRPTIAEATSGGSDPFSPATTTKGKILSGLLLAARGAAAGAAASVPTNPHISPGLGPALSAGFETPLIIKQQQNILAQQGLEQEKEKAQIASLPLQAAAQRQLITSEIDRNEAMADTRGNFTLKPGDVRQDRNGVLLGRGADVGDVANSKQSGKNNANAEAAATAIATRKQEAKDAGMDQDQTLEHVYGIKPKTGYGGKTQAYIDAAGGDVTKGLAKMTEDDKQVKPSRTASPDFVDKQATASYNTQIKRLDSIRKPIDESGARLARLNASLNLRTPQADAEIAPQLMVAMAGGQGSGVRITQAEIDRTEGGRSGWENLRAKIQHWNTDPSQALSLTDAQRSQMRQLVGLVNGKITAKQGILNDAEQSLSDPDGTPLSHRQLMSRLHQKLESVDGGSGTGKSSSANDNSTTDPFAAFGGKKR